jgi:hypothetical protein
VSSLEAVTIMTIPAANVTHVDFNVIATDTTTNASRQVSKLMAISFYGEVDYSEYGSLMIGSMIGDFQVVADGTDNILLKVLPTNTDSINYSAVAIIYY